MFDRRIRTAGQVEKMLGYKPLAALLEPGQDRLSPKAIADKTRRLALALERERKQSDKPGSLILLTSVKPDSAVTSLALDLAIDYKKMGVRAVVVEVNPLKPDERYMSKHTTSGLVNLVLDPNLAVPEVVSPADDRYPDRIAIGSSTEGLLFDYERVQALLEKISKTYTFVILDAAPILLSADTEFFASISDITLLLIAAGQTKPYEIKRAVQVLERIDPKVMGFVVTRLEIFQGGGYYSLVHGVDSQSQQTDTHLFAKYFRKK
jgi:Mrp family chromosome partitioning ATPase